MQNIEAILIDPRARTIEPVTLTGKNAYHALKAGVFPGETGRGLIEHVNLGPMGHRFTASGYVDEEGLLMDWSQQAFFRLDEGMHPLAGRMVIVLTDPEGETAGLPERLRQGMLAQLRKTVRWLDPKDVRVPAPSFTPIGPDFQPTGPAEPLTPDGVTEWDYDHQPR
jgi:hypothetical protein